MEGDGLLGSGGEKLEETHLLAVSLVVYVVWTILLLTQPGLQINIKKLPKNLLFRALLRTCLPLKTS